ncbi:MAG: TolC family protein, partial [bacterium]|nr:TolC family protein [bacterium]
ENRKRLGTAEQSDWLGAKALLLERENALLESEARLKDAKERVAELLCMTDHADREGGGNPSVEFQENLDDEIRFALASRGDYLGAKEELRSKEITLQTAKNQKFPVIDLVASLEMNGLRGTLGPALEDSFTAENPSVFAGVEVKVPLENREKRSLFRREELQKKQMIFDLEALERRVITEVQQAYRELDLRLKQLKTFEEIRNLQAQKWRGERVKFSQGRSSSDTVIRFEREQVEAEWKAIEAGFQARLSRIKLREAASHLLSGEGPP